MWRNGKVVNCAKCGKEIYRNPHNMLAKNYCSYDCKNASQRGTTRGKGNRFIRSDGYVAVWCPTHPTIANRTNRNRYVLEHRLVMESSIGRNLTKKEHVHHKNGIKTDNRIENLEVVSDSMHAGITTRATAQKNKQLKQELETYRRLYGPLPKYETQNEFDHIVCTTG
jgi:hypothetical protein